MRKSKYPNLSREIARQGLAIKTMAEEIGARSDTVSRWIAGLTPIPLEKAKTIRNMWFPAFGIDELFACD